jgi:hypothetical protein
MRLRALASDIRCLAHREGVAETVRKVGSGLRGHELIVLSERLDEIAEITLEPRLALGDLGPADLPALAEFNRRRFDRRATGRFAAGLERGERGYARLWGYVRGDNRPARWLHGMRGYETVGNVHVRLGRMR